MNRDFVFALNWYICATQVFLALSLINFDFSLITFVVTLLTSCRNIGPKFPLPLPIFKFLATRLISGEFELRVHVYECVGGTSFLVRSFPVSKHSCHFKDYISWKITKLKMRWESQFYIRCIPKCVFVCVPELSVQCALYFEHEPFGRVHIAHNVKSLSSISARMKNPALFTKGQKYRYLRSWRLIVLPWSNEWSTSVIINGETGDFSMSSGSEDMFKFKFDSARLDTFERPDVPQWSVEDESDLTAPLKLLWTSGELKHNFTSFSCDFTSSPCK